MTNLSNKLVLLFFILSGYFLGINYAQNITIKKIDFNRVLEVSLRHGARHIVYYATYTDFDVCFWDRLGTDKKTPKPSTDITKIYNYAIRHDFLPNKAYEMILGGVVGKIKILYPNENTITSIRLKVITAFYLNLIFSYKKNNQDDKLIEKYQEKIKNILDSLHYQDEKISFSLYLNLQKMCNYDFYDYILDNPSFYDILLSQQVTTLGPLRLEFIEDYGISEILTCFVTKSENALSHAILAEERNLLYLEESFKKLELKWHKRLFELQIACMMNIGELKEVSFSE